MLLNVTPLTLAVEAEGGIAWPVIPRGSRIPVSRHLNLTTLEDNQPSIALHVIQGERPMAADNKTLVYFILDGIPAAPRGVPQIEVTFDIDAEGILNVSARDKGTGREQKITITASRGLSKEEVERMKREAEVHAAEDARKLDESKGRILYNRSCGFRQIT